MSHPVKRKAQKNPRSSSQWCHPGLRCSILDSVASLAPPVLPVKPSHSATASQSYLSKEPRARRGCRRVGLCMLEQSGSSLEAPV